MPALREVVLLETELQRAGSALEAPGLRDARREAKQSISRLEEQVRSLEAAEVAATARAEELAAEQADLASRLHRVRAAEGARDYRQATQIEHETEVLQGKLDAVEEAELELMEESEERKVKLADAVAELELKRASYATLVDDQERLRGELTAEREAKLAELNALIAQLPEPTAALIRAAHERGIRPALALVHGGYCGNCHMALSSALRGRVASNPSALSPCEECGALLVAEDEGDL